MNKKILEHFKSKDLVMYLYLLDRNLEMYPKEKSELYFYRLCRSIAFQQLSGKAANSIFSRLQNAIGKETFNENELLKYDVEQLRAFGFSYAKSQYMRNIAQASIEGIVDFKNLDYQDNDYIINHLTQIKGVGKWTAEMFLLFTLGREDIFSFGDLGLKKGILKMYKKKSITTKQIEKLTNKWKPYRSYASLALWDILDNQSPTSGTSTTSA